MTTRAKKDVQLAEISEALRTAQAIVLTDYRGFSVAELADLRGQLRQEQVQYLVAKNTLTRRAVRQAGLPDAGQALEGPTALAFILGDLQGSARKLAELSRARKPLPIKAVMLGTQLSGPAALQQLATLPARDQLYAQVVGGIAGPVVGLLSVLQGAVTSLLYLLQARAQQLGDASEVGSTEAAPS